MRLTNYPFSTLREDPSDAEISSHKLLYRAGFIRKAAGGIYAYTPLAVRVIQKITNIVRQELNRQGGLEVLLPMLQPSEPWEESGRWEQYGDEMFTLRDRHGRSFCLGPTHEDIITWLMRSEMRSYKQLPVMLYQIANKYRDEIRPRFGLMRCREFLMKDLYSFDTDKVGLDRSYEKMRDAYNRIFTRCGLGFRAVEADAGLIGGDVNHEFVVLAESGEAEVVYCNNCNYAANREAAECSVDATPSTPSSTSLQPCEVATPGARTIEEVATFLDCTTDDLLKTLIFSADGRLYAALVRGSHSVNPVKLAKLVGVPELEMASEHDVVAATGAPVGFAGPVGLSGDITIVCDSRVYLDRGYVVGANKPDTHVRNVIPGIHFSIDVNGDIGQVDSGDKCPRCQDGILGITRGIEVGHIFKLGRKYSVPMNATFLNSEGKEVPIEMGCYGIGISRTMAAAVEQSHDSNGIIWPLAIAPYQVVVVPVSTKDTAQMEAATHLYGELTKCGIEVVLDDRDERPGVKFKDADLVGYPIRVTIGPKALAEGEAELKVRSQEEVKRVPLGEITGVIASMVRFSDNTYLS